MESEKSWKTVSNMLINRNSDVLFLGVYDTERFEPVSLAGCDSVLNQSRSEDGSIQDQWRIKLLPPQARALFSHIKYGRTSMVRVDIAHLQFACLRHGNSALTGVSNFNMEPQRLHEADRLLFNITNEHYTRQDSLEGVHALNMAAILQDKELLVGIVKASDISVIRLLKDLVLVKDGSISNDSYGIVNKGLASLKGGSYNINTEQGITVLDNKPLSEVCRVPLRQSTKSDAEKKNDKLKRQTSFCEDWRTATIKSIEALQNIGPFSEKPNDNDTLPLLDDIGSPAILDINQEPEQVHAPSATSQTPETRRKSRVTLV